MEGLPDPSFATAAIAVLGIVAMLLALAAAIRHGVRVIHLEARVNAIREEQRQMLIARGVIGPDPDDIGEVDIIEDDEPELGVEADVEPQASAA